MAPSSRNASSTLGVTRPHHRRGHGQSGVIVHEVADSTSVPSARCQWVTSDCQHWLGRLASNLTQELRGRLWGWGAMNPRWRSIRQILDTEGTCPWRCYQVNSRTPGGRDEGAPTRGTKPTSLRERMRKEHGSTPSDPSAPSVRGRIDARWL